MSQVRGFISEILKKRTYSQRSLSVAAAKAKLGLELLDKVSAIDANTTEELVLALLKDLNGARAVRRGLYGYKGAVPAKALEECLDLTRAERNILLSQRVWDSRSLLLKLELYWWDNKLTPRDFVDKIFKHKGGISHDAVKDAAALVVGGNFEKVVSNDLVGPVSVKKLFRNLCIAHYGLHDLVAVLEKELPDAFDLKAFEASGITSSKLDLRTLCGTKKSWRKDLFIFSVLEAVHNGNFSN